MTKNNNQMAASKEDIWGLSIMRNRDEGVESPHTNVRAQAEKLQQGKSNKQTIH